MDAEEGILETDGPQPTNKLYPSFIPCKHCGFDLWTLLNYNLVKQAIKDGHKFGNNVVGVDAAVKKKKKMVRMVCDDNVEDSSSC